jgi:hypothetical protein
MADEPDATGAEPARPSARELRAARRRAHEEEKQRRAAGGGGGKGGRKGDKMGKGRGEQGPSTDERRRH